ncbi:MAG: hypothetical protein WBL93_12915 [Lutisporaceae bacterium]
MSQEEYWDKFINKYAAVYRKAEEIGVDFRLVDELVIEAYKIEVMSKQVYKKEV